MKYGKVLISRGGSTTRIRAIGAVICANLRGIVKATSNSARPFPKTGEIAIFANFTKFTGSFPPFFFCLFNLLRMVRLLHLELHAASPAAADGTHNVSHERNERRAQISPSRNDPSEIPGVTLDTRLRHF
jgi:hypothetical protein